MVRRVIDHARLVRFEPAGRATPRVSDRERCGPRNRPVGANQVEELASQLEANRPRDEQERDGDDRDCALTHRPLDFIDMT
jgi:hypothetical protein